MTKRNKITFLIAEALLAVLAAYFFYSIFHGDVPPKKVAVIVENSGDKRWDSLLNGMKQAAKVQNLSLIICNTDEQESSEDEQEMIREQLENDVDAFIINPAPGQDTKQVLEQLQGTKPFVLIMQDIYSYEADAASSFVTVKPDNYKMGQELAEQMLKNTSGLMNGKRIGVVAGNARTEESRNRVRGFCEVMEAGGGRIIWKYNQESKEDAGEILKAKEKVDYLAVLDPYILDEVGEKAENGFYSGAEIYGIGTSIKAFSLLDAGKIQCLIVPDLYEVGYESMNEIASKLKNSWYQMESHETEIQVVYKKDLFLLNIIWISLEDGRIDENMLALSIGLTTTGVYGLARAANSEQWYRNIILHDSLYSCEQLLEFVYPELAKQNSWKLPVWYYISKSNMKSELAEEKAPHSYTEIVTESTIKRNRSAIGERTAWEVWTQEKDNLMKAIRLLGCMPEEKIDVNQYRSILQAIFTENNNILSSLDSPNRSNLHRMIRIYDFLEYGQKKTP